jgi:FkbM family methyltransferase
MIRHSQNNEQDLILAHFGPAKGVFLDLGANDGRTLSNTHALALLGWQGVCVEPSPTAFAMLEGLYQGNDRIECHNVAICDGNGPMILHESGNHIGREDFALLSTIKPVELDRWKGTKEVFVPTSIECVTFAELLNRSAHSKFDLISMDIEGAEWDVLQQIDLEAVGCRMLIIEVNDREPKPYVDYCARFGMRLMTRNGENLILTK